MTEEAASQALAEQGVLGVVVLGLAWACVFLLRALMRSNDARTHDALTVAQQGIQTSERTTAAITQLTVVVQRLAGEEVRQVDVAVRSEE